MCLRTYEILWCGWGVGGGELIDNCSGGTCRSELLGELRLRDCVAGGPLAGRRGSWVGRTPSDAKSLKHGLLYSFGSHHSPPTSPPALPHRTKKKNEICLLGVRFRGISFAH